jgi:hypothetical protein
MGRLFFKTAEDQTMKLPIKKRDVKNPLLKKSGLAQNKNPHKSAETAKER